MRHVRVSDLIMWEGVKVAVIEGAWNLPPIAQLANPVGGEGCNRTIPLGEGAHPYSSLGHDAPSRDSIAAAACLPRGVGACRSCVRRERSSRRSWGVRWAGLRVDKRPST